MKKFFSLIAAVLFAGSMMATEVTVSKTVEELATANSWANGTVVTPFALDEVITVSTNASDANTGKYYTSGQQIRLYQSGAAELIISAAEGYTISSITLTYVSQNTGIFVEAESGVAVDFENVQSATFTVGNSGEATNGQARVTAISVTYNGEGGVTPPPADTYTVAGSDAAIFGEAWNPALAANDMVLAAGIYKWEKAELNLTAGDIEFKVVKNHSWDNPAWPAQNYVLNIAEDGEYTITITFDLANEAVAAEAVKKEAPAEPTNCAEAAEAALSVSANNELYNDGAVYTIEGYVTGIKTAYSDQYHNISFWMADAADGGEVLQAYRAVCESEEDAPAVGDKVQVTGSLTKYNTTPEFAAGCTFVIVTDPLPVEHTYTVAGDNADLFGTTWTPANEDNDMALVEGLYTWEKTEQTLPAGNVAFKVCEDHAWTNCWPADNYVLNIPEGGVYTITITFNAESKEVAANAQKTGDAVVIPTVAMHGNFLGSWADTENFEVAEGNATASLSLNIAAGNYEFGMRIGGSGNWTANGAAFTRENNSAEVVAGQGNLTLAADVEGAYLFTWTYETNTLTITYPDAPVVPDTIVIDIESEVQYTDYVAAAGWWQFMAENDEYEISISNVSTTQAAGVYTVADLDQDYTYVYIKADSTEVHFVDGEFTLTEGEDGSRTIEGVMTGDDGNIYNIKLVFRIPTAETIVNVEIPNWGIYDGSEYYGIASYVFAGKAADSTYVQIVIPGTNPVGQFTYDDVYARGTGIEVAGDYQSIYSMNITINVSDAGRAIITADILCLNNTLYHVTTLVGEGVDAIEAAQKAVKMIQNGQLIIEKNGVRYNANGQIVR